MFLYTYHSTLRQLWLACLASMVVTYRYVCKHQISAITFLVGSSLFLVRRSSPRPTLAAPRVYRLRRLFRQPYIWHGLGYGQFEIDTGCPSWALIRTAILGFDTAVLGFDTDGLGLDTDGLGFDTDVLGLDTDGRPGLGYGRPSVFTGG